MCPGKHLQSKVHHTRDPIGPFKTEKENQVGSTHPVDHQTETGLIKYHWWVAKKHISEMLHDGPLVIRDF